METINYCLIEGGPYVENEQIGILYDCAYACKLNADFIIRESGYSAQAANICEEICDDCADGCGRFSDDEKMLKCSKICRECGISCRDMIGQHERS